MTHFLRVIGLPSFYEYTPWVDYLNGVMACAGILIFFYLIKYFFSSPSKTNALDFKEDNRIVSPFLISEMSQGEVSFTVNKHLIWYRVFAVVLIFFVLSTPVGELISDSTWYYDTVWMF